VDAEFLQGIVDRVRLVPEKYRDFDHDTSTAMRIYRIGGPLLSDLLDLGFPHRSSAGDRYFDELDLDNVSLALRLPSPRHLAMRRWPQIFRAVMGDRPVRYDVEVSAQCGSAETGHQCDFRLPAAVLALGADAGPTARRFTLRRDVGATGRTVEAPPELRRLFTEMDGFQFHILPVALYGDLSFLAETSLANCELASRYLFRRAVEEGWEARRSFGLLLSSPYSVDHFWAEFRLDGSWTAFDPFLITSLERWGVLAPSEVPTTLVLNSAVIRVAEDWIDLVQDAEVPAQVSLLTRHRPLTGAAS
jgi:hypothetical protein